MHRVRGRWSALTPFCRCEDCSGIKVLGETEFTGLDVSFDEECGEEEHSRWHT